VGALGTLSLYSQGLLMLARSEERQMRDGSNAHGGATLLGDNALGGESAARSPWQPLLLFVGIVFALSWLLWLPRILDLQGGLGLPSALARVLNYSAIIVPSLVALALTLYLSGVRGLRSFLVGALRWQFKPLYYALALLALGAVYLLGLLVYTLVSGRTPEEWLHLPGAATVVVVALAAVGEEFGWRGFVLPRLLPRIGTLGSSLLIGLFWTLWHGPEFFAPEGRVYGTSFATVLIELTALSMIYTWLSVRANSLIPAILLHWSQLLWTIMVPFPAEGAWARTLAIIVAGVLAAATLPRPLLGGESEQLAKRKMPDVSPGTGL
jgi:hypothetical protein